VTIRFMLQFLEDLRDADDARVVRRALDQIIDAQGEFRRDSNDHRFHGIENAWIRYVSGGKTAYRLIYIQNGSEILLYRVGGHSIEDRLQGPGSLEGIALAPSEPFRGRSQAVRSSGLLLKTSSEPMLSKMISSLYHVGHREIWLVSPYLSESLFCRNAPFGRFLDRAMEDGAAIALITRLGEKLNTGFLEDLEARGIAVYLHPKLHAKLYIFELELSSLSQYNRDMSSMAILGSANLTEMGLSLEQPSGHEELCYRISPDQFYEAKSHAEWLANQSQDLQSVKLKFNRRF
jgi:phosphatidylserine/phosphatidylglycerophosphate/cardiolipin synthase-like enzyme